MPFSLSFWPFRRKKKEQINKVESTPAPAPDPEQTAAPQQVDLPLSGEVIQRITMLGIPPILGEGAGVMTTTLLPGIVSQQPGSLAKITTDIRRIARFAPVLNAADFPESLPALRSFDLEKLNEQPGKISRFTAEPPSETGEYIKILPPPGISPWSVAGQVGFAPVLEPENLPPTPIQSSKETVRRERITGSMVEPVIKPAKKEQETTPVTKNVLISGLDVQLSGQNVIKSPDVMLQAIQLVKPASSEDVVRNSMPEPSSREFFTSPAYKEQEQLESGMISYSEKKYAEGMYIQRKIISPDNMLTNSNLLQASPKPVERNLLPENGPIRPLLEAQEGNDRLVSKISSKPISDAGSHPGESISSEPLSKPVLSPLEKPEQPLVVPPSDEVTILSRKMATFGEEAPAVEPIIPQAANTGIPTSTLAVEQMTLLLPHEAESSDQSSQNQSTGGILQRVQSVENFSQDFLKQYINPGVTSPKEVPDLRVLPQLSAEPGVSQIDQQAIPPISMEAVIQRIDFSREGESQASQLISSPLIQRENMPSDILQGAENHGLESVMPLMQTVKTSVDINEQPLVAPPPVSSVGSSQELSMMINRQTTPFNLPTSLPGGFTPPEMPLPPSLGELPGQVNEQLIERIAQQVASAQNMQMPQVPQLPNMEKLADQVWQQIQRRIQIERERSRGLS